MSKVIDETGNHYGRLKVIKQATGKYRHARWVCLCDCGISTIVRGKLLRNGHTQSCGCLQRDRAAECATLHGDYGTPTHTTWRGMKDRCANLNRLDYGGRGIGFCERWVDFANFLEDMGPRPSLKHSLDRIDNNGNYTPENCRWATRKQQGRNARSNVLLTHDGKTQCLAAWCEEIGMKRGTLYQRIFRLNWSIERALYTPVRSIKMTQAGR